jgi:asparagine synthetase B (glutamine-hydrolysing)
VPLHEQGLTIQNFIWRDNSLFEFSTVSDLWAAEVVLPFLTGHFAIDLREGSRCLLARDPLGVNKLFFAVAGGRVVSSNYLLNLLQAGYGIDQICSVPFGTAVCVDAQVGSVQCSRYSRVLLNHELAGGGDDFGECAKNIRSALNRTFGMIRQVISHRPVYITMSGGLDSTVIALLAKEHLAAVEGITLSVVHGNATGESEDVQFARMVASDIKIPLTVVRATDKDILDNLDETLMWGQDWRDFNVHCGLVNAAIGKALISISSARGYLESPLLLTGDTMNELLVDYEPVWYGDRELYRLPRLSRARLRGILVSGLDSGDREVGILAKMGLSVIQPYAMCAEAYLRIPPAFLDRPDCKATLARCVMEDRIPEYVLTRRKVRAQAGGSTVVGGTLAVLLDAGVDQEFLKERWCELFRLPQNVLPGIIRAGMYKPPTTRCTLRTM